MKELNFKKTILSAIILSLLLAVAPCKKAEAGISVVVAGGMGEENVQIVAGLGIMAGGVYFMKLFPNLWGVTGGIILIFLDADGSFNHNSLEKKFSEMYPFIDNAKTITGLANLVKSKTSMRQVEGQRYLVSLSEKETRTILASANLSESEIEQVVSDLK